MYGTSGRDQKFISPIIRCSKIGLRRHDDLDFSAELTHKLHSKDIYSQLNMRNVKPIIRGSQSLAPASNRFR